VNPLNQCGACGEDFTSLRAFDTHCVGKHELDYPKHPDGRRCLTPDELAASRVRSGRPRTLVPSRASGCGSAALPGRPRHGRQGLGGVTGLNSSPNGHIVRVDNVNAPARLTPPGAGHRRLVPWQ